LADRLPCRHPGVGNAEVVIEELRAMQGCGIRSREVVRAAWLISEGERTLSVQCDGR
jgi:hypothetical protein